ncbi:MAG: alpha/beta hydrolase [Rickettsiales bacterium]|nr:alpha/beta hydrolase [Rickettsiales bacterium]
MSSPKPHKTLQLESGATLAYHHHEGSTPGVMFMGGFMSDMEGGKATAVEAFCVEHGIQVTRFDYQGHGMSSGVFENGTIGEWAQDAIAILDEVTTGPQIVIGSSMGGWLMLHVALARPERVTALIGIAAAPDFTENLLWEQMTDEQKQELEEKGVFYAPSCYGDDPYPISKTLIEDGRNQMLLDQPINIDMPVRLIHGCQDPDVPWQLSTQLSDQLTSNDVEISLVKNGDHRMSSPEQIALLLQTIKTLRKHCA